MASHQHIIQTRWIRNCTLYDCLSAANSRSYRPVAKIRKSPGKGPIATAFIARDQIGIDAGAEVNFLPAVFH